MTPEYEVVDALKKARGLVAAGWTTGWFAHTASGLETRSWCKNATMFCIDGAVSRAVGRRPNLSRSDDERTAALSREVRSALQRQLPSEGHSLPSWNDAPDRTQADVLALFDKAIALAEGGVSP